MITMLMRYVFIYTVLYRYINTIWEGFQTIKRNCQTNSCKTVECLHGISTGACVEKTSLKKGYIGRKKINFSFEGYAF